MALKGPKGLIVTFLTRVRIDEALETMTVHQRQLGIVSTARMVRAISKQQQNDRC